MSSPRFMRKIGKIPAYAGMTNILFLAMACIFAAFPALAQIQYPPEYATACTYNPQFNIPLPAAGSGIITLLVGNISAIVSNVAMALYNSILAQYTFQVAVRAALTLSVVIYGILFTFGMTQITMMDFLIRVVKIGIVATLLSPASWTYFYFYVGYFFHDGTNWLIATMSSIALGMVAGINPMYPFAVLDNAIATLTSSRLFVTLIATFFTGPYGIFIALIIIMGIGTFASALFQAMWIYLMSLVVRCFLFALAPIFLCFLLFGRTRHLFDGWVNALVSSMLQPVFLFAFFAFFSKLVEASLYNLLRVPVCWTPPGSTWQGTPFDVWMWRFMVPVNAGGVWRWEMYGGGWSFTGADIAGAPIFPLSIIDVLIFVLLVQLAWRFNGVVVQIAKDIAGASLALNISGAVTEWMNPAKGRMDAMKDMANRAGGNVKGLGRIQNQAQKQAADARAAMGGQFGRNAMARFREQMEKMPIRPGDR